MLYLDDLRVGATFRTGTAVVTAEAIYAFAYQFDPQPFHLDPVAAAESPFGELVASGWQTASITMRLLIEGEFKLAGGLIGLSLDQLAWPRAVRPGDQLNAVTEVLEVRPSRSRPERGTAKIRTITYNQHGQEVQIMISNQLVPRRSPAD